MTSSKRRLTMQVLAVLASATMLTGVPSAPQARAQPPGFPDLNAFTETPASQDFSRPDRSANGYAYFRTPDGLSCMVGSLVRCSGPLPGLAGAEYGDCALVLQSYEAARRSEPFRFEKSTDGCPPPTDELLAVGQKATFVSNDTTICAVGAGQLTACIRNDHGFVLQPSGSWVF
ncbi:MAG: hypothetical protein ACRDUX_03120 [Mycobacterium sp.]